MSIIARIIGWGCTMAGGTTSDVLLEADAPMRTDQVMADAYGARFIQQFMVGAGDGTTDTCQGDSGGPLLVPDTATAAPDDFALAGLTSFGRGCADPNFPGIYTRISSEPLNGWVHDRINEPPVAQGDAYSTDEDQPLTQPAPGVLANDTDVNGDTLTAVGASGPSHGTLNLNADGSFTYTPEKDFNGTDTFTYRASDRQAESSVATVTITVKDTTPPTVSSISPPAEQRGVSLRAPNISVTFSEEMEPRTLASTANVKLDRVRRSAKGVSLLEPNVPASVAYPDDSDPNTRTATLTLSSSLVKASWYRVTVATGAKDKAGNPLAADKVWYFQTSQR